MIEQFGEAYRAYMNRTGCVGSRFRGPPAPRAAAGRGLFDEILPCPCACTMPQPGHSALRRARLRAPEAPLRPPTALIKTVDPKRSIRNARRNVLRLGR